MPKFPGDRVDAPHARHARDGDPEHPGRDGAAASRTSTLDRRSGRLPVRAGRVGQRVQRGPRALPARDGRRDRDRPRPADRGVAAGPGDRRPGAPRSDREGRQVRRGATRCPTPSPARVPGRARDDEASAPDAGADGPRHHRSGTSRSSDGPRAASSAGSSTVTGAAGAIEIGSLLGYSAILIAGSMPPTRAPHVRRGESASWPGWCGRTPPRPAWPGG